jgi:hypothetical protein
MIVVVVQPIAGDSDNDAGEGGVVSLFHSPALLVPQDHSSNFAIL